MRFRFALLMALLATTALVHAANIISASGPSPFGFGGQAVFVTGWSQGLLYTNVTITMPLEDIGGGGGVEGTTYLMNQIGPGTTTANQVAPPISISGLTNAFTSRVLFTGLHFRRAIIMSCWSQPTRAHRPCLRKDRAAPVVTTETSVTFLGIADRHQPPFIRLPPVLAWARAKAVFLSPSLAIR